MAGAEGKREMVDHAVLAAKQKIRETLPRSEAGRPVPLITWWDTSRLFQDETIPRDVLRQAKLEILFGNNMKERTFREFPPITFFTIRQRIDPGDEERFKDALTTAALGFEETHGYPFRYSGFFSQSKINGENISFYNFTHYPRTREPVITYEQTIAASIFLEQQLLQQGIIPNLTMIRGKWNDSRVTDKECRVILGREEGYSTDRKAEEKTKVYTLQEMAEILGPTISVRDANIFSVGKNPDGTPNPYEEPAAEVRCSINELPIVYKAAEKMRQARFSVDAFWKRGISYTVEIGEFCKGQQADPIPSISEWLTNPRYKHFLVHM